MVAASDTYAATPPPFRVLVVEDNDDSRELMLEVLRAAGVVDVALAGSAEIGLQLLRREAYDLIVTDIELPAASGFDMLDQANAEGRLVETAVVVCSASHWRRRQAIDRGAPFLPKPLSVDTLVDVVQRLRGEPD